MKKTGFRTTIFVLVFTTAYCLLPTPSSFFPSPYSLLPTPYLYAYTYLGRTPPGDPLRGHSARTSAMGNISAACIKDEPNLYFNPASLMYSTNKQISLSLNYIPAEEKTITEDQPLGLNFQSYTLGSVLISLPIKECLVGVVVFPLYDMQYRSEQKTYTASVLTSYIKTENTGTLYSYTISGARKIGTFSFGLGLNFLTTDYEIKTEKYDISTGEQSYIVVKKDSVYGTSCSVSTVIDLSEIVNPAIVSWCGVNLAISYIPEAYLKSKYASDFKLPNQYTVSTTVSIEEELKSIVAFEMIFSENKKAEFHLGVEHLTEFKEIPIRYGIGFVPHPADDKHYSFSISAGSGVKLNQNALLDFSVSYENINIIHGSSYIQQNSYKLTCSTKFVF